MTPRTSKAPPAPGSGGFDDVLSAVDARLDHGREQRLRRNIARATVKVRFEELLRSVIKPAMQKLMASLHVKGYPTRLRETKKNEMCLEFTLGPKARLSLQIHLSDQGQVAFCFDKNMSPILREEVSCDDIDRTTIDRRLADLLSRGLGM